MVTGVAVVFDEAPIINAHWVRNITPPNSPRNMLGSIWPEKMQKEGYYSLDSQDEAVSWAWIRSTCVERSCGYHRNVTCDVCHVIPSTWCEGEGTSLVLCRCLNFVARIPKKSGKLDLCTLRCG